MNANQLINMIIKMFVRKAVSKGMDAGMKRVSGSGNAKQDMTPEERQQAKAGRQVARKASQSMKIARRMGRM